MLFFPLHIRARKGYAVSVRFSRLLKAEDGKTRQSRRVLSFNSQGQLCYTPSGDNTSVRIISIATSLDDWLRCPTDPDGVLKFYLSTERSPHLWRPMPTHADRSIECSQALNRGWQLSGQLSSTSSGKLIAKGFCLAEHSAGGAVIGSSTNLAAVAHAKAPGGRTIQPRSSSTDVGDNQASAPVSDAAQRGSSRSFAQSIVLNTPMSDEV